MSSCLRGGRAILHYRGGSGGGLAAVAVRLVPLRPPPIVEGRLPSASVSVSAAAADAPLPLPEQLLGLVTDLPVRSEGVVPTLVGPEISEEK